MAGLSIMELFTRILYFSKSFYNPLKAAVWNVLKSHYCDVSNGLLLLLFFVFSLFCASVYVVCVYFMYRSLPLHVCMWVNVFILCSVTPILA